MAINISKSIFQNKYIIILLLFPLFILSSCSKEDAPLISPTPKINSFAFLRTNNQELSKNVYLQIEGNKIIRNLPYNAKITELIATFYINGVLVSIGKTIQQSGITTNDFSNTVTYTVNAKDGTTEHYDVDLTLFNGLPIFFINTDEGQTIDSKEEYREGDFSFYGSNLFENIESDMKIRGRGNSTWFVHPKKPYQMKLPEKTEIMGMPEDKKWLFLAEYSDKTFLRNKTSFELGHLSILEWTPSSYFADVVINDEYNGTYLISQKVEEGKNRVNLNNNGFLLEIDQLERLNPDDVYFYTSQFLINIKYPELNYSSSEYEYITNYISNFETALYGNDFTDSQTGYQKYADIDSFVDWFLINEIAKNVDAKDWSSIFMNLAVGEKLKMGPIWDFDLTFGNVNYAESEFFEGFWVKDHKWIKRMFEDSIFVSKVKTRFAYFRSHESEIYKSIDDNANMLRLSMEANNKRWDVLGNWVCPNSQVFSTYQEEVDYLKNWINKRMIWMNSALSQL